MSPLFQYVLDRLQIFLLMLSEFKSKINFYSPENLWFPDDFRG